MTLNASPNTAEAAAADLIPPADGMLASLPEETMAEALERRRSLSREERASVRPPAAVQKSVKALFKWQFTCLYQDNSILVIVASAVLGFEIVKTLVDLFKALL